ncbi:SDR family NAD(P)-dependent oxidoreductase [Calycomorphotria hydatis]|uniref:SDR family NAD(P)-dependent oxidoreductase n=1 Tax=Calycomorphotria hydatis TaxID=2528027 RepID=UPI0011A63A3B|nr:SDR family oxidoreductase [Calycomorphotria hydatis]
MIEAYANRWALITGASSGIGAEFARVLAARGMHLILVARRRERLEELAAALFDQHATRCVVIPADLSVREEVEAVMREINDQKINVELLINNAGFSIVGDVPNTDREKVLNLIGVNISALTDLTYRILPGMMSRGHGAIINIASIAAFQPVAYMGAYAASKAFVLHFSEALWAEARDHGVTVTAACPGVTKTDFFEKAGVGEWLKKQHALTPDLVVKAALKGMERKKLFLFTGWRNKLLALLVRIAPRRIAVLESRKYFRPKNDSSKSNLPAEESSPTVNSHVSQKPEAAVESQHTSA